jgi:hypothetical protein
MGAIIENTIRYHMILACRDKKKELKIPKLKEFFFSLFETKSKRFIVEIHDAIYFRQFENEGVI